MINSESSESDEGPNIDIYHDDEFGFVDATSSGKVELQKFWCFAHSVIYAYGCIVFSYVRATTK